MDSQPQIGQIIWHDLLTVDVATALNFYAELLGWNYQIEHATSFVWHSGEANYPIITVNQVAHGGFVDAGTKTTSRWVAYVQVTDVDAVTDQASSLGATIERKPFDIPGVGRCAVIRDRQGAVICPTVPTYTAPAPEGTFQRDELNTVDVEMAAAFYHQLFDWQMKEVEEVSPRQLTVENDGTTAETVSIVGRSLTPTKTAVWIPYFAVNELDLTLTKAQSLGANVCIPGDTVGTKQVAVLNDPTGATFGLLC